MDEDRRYEIRQHLTAAQKDHLVDLYANEWWTKGRDRAIVDRLLAGSDLIFAAIALPAERLVAFARVITDHTYLAFVEDVIVASDHRGMGVGKLLIDAICADRALQDVVSIELVCQPEMVPFYERWGFTDQVGRSTLMRRTANPVLTGPADDADASASGAP
jgi:GNAT superfamily N-acetyltransferase